MLGVVAELGHEFVVGLGIFALQVLHLTAAFADLLDETAAGRVVLLVGLQVLDEFVDFGREEGDLNLWGARVRGVRLELLNNFLLERSVQHNDKGLRSTQIWI